MNRIKYIGLSACVMASVIGCIAFGKQLNVQGPDTATAVLPEQGQEGAVAEHTVYRMLFHHAFVFSQEADKAERRGNSASAHAFRTAFGQDAGLGDEQVKVLNDLAAECEREVKEQDAKAKVIIDARRAQYLQTDQLLPPSPELEAMQRERNAIILRYRDRLRAAFGEQEWGRFQGFIRQHVANGITPTYVPPGQRE
jgi:hypothetical protein